jgi:hypothetical protein
MKLYIFALLLSIAPCSLSAEQHDLKIDPHGAVLCSYAITVGLLARGELCNPENEQGQSILRDLRDKHRDFVNRNADWTTEHFTQFEAQQSETDQTTCAREDITQMYDLVTQDQNVLAEIEQSLSIDREPVWNPCL